MKQNRYHCPGVGVGEFELYITRNMMEDVTEVMVSSLLFCTFVQSLKTGTCFVMMCASTLNKYGAPVNNVARRRQVSSLELAGHPSV